MRDDSGVALITGGSSGVGRATARALARRGRPTVLVARRPEPLEEAAAELRRYAPCTPVALDLAGGDARVEKEFTRLAEELGPVDVLVNCAGHGMYTPFLDVSPEETRALFEVHWFAPAAAVRAVLPGMLSRGRGHVVNIASVSAKAGPWGHGAYASAKAGLATLTESLAAEYGGRGVHFSVVHPGLVDTPFFHTSRLAPLRARTARRMIPPDRVGRAVAGLLERPRPEVCVPRHYRVLDLLRAVSPAALSRLIARQSGPGPRGTGGPS
ncbi:SDR family NAD(P)-dependent oxidoreductase [Streptomyces sp. TR06-5]|uniref:SDR family NAD(P)-dependent oxidoreductase n=1 Tax=unclassified Streptomyces TaxID=2593676 RepID=UPI0039A201C7